MNSRQVEAERLRQIAAAKERLRERRNNPQANTPSTLKPAVGIVFAVAFVAGMIFGQWGVVTVLAIVGVVVTVHIYRLKHPGTKPATKAPGRQR